MPCTGAEWLHPPHCVLISEKSRVVAAGERGHVAAGAGAACFNFRPAQKGVESWNGSAAAALDMHATKHDRARAVAHRCVADMAVKAGWIIELVVDLCPGACY